MTERYVADEMYRLRRMILADCHIKGRVVEIKLDPHTNIEGTNTAGKTTLLRVQSLFWGLKPTEAQEAAADKLPMAEYFFPRENSLLIFEYTRPEGQICQVLITSNKDKSILQYRFVNKAYDENDYGSRLDNGNYKPRSVRDIGSTLSAKNIEHSAMMAGSDYKAVIQNNAKHLRKNKNRVSLISYARLYSMCGHSSTLVHQEHNIKSVLSKHGKITAKKKMVAHLLQGSGDQNAFSAPTIDPVEFAALDERVGVLKHFKPKMGKIESMVGLGDRFASLIALISTHKYQLHQVKTHVKESLADAEELFNTLSADEDALKKARETEMDSLNAEASKNTGDREDNDKRISDILRKHNEWSEQDIDSLKSNIAALPSKKRELSDSETRYQAQLSEAEEDQLTYEKQKNKVKDTFEKDVAWQNNLLEAKKTELQEQKTASEARSRSLQNAHNDDKATLQAEYDSEKDAIGEELIRLRVAAENKDQTQDEESKVLSSERDVSDAEVELKGYTDEYIAEVDAEGQKSKDHSDLLDSFNKLSQKVGELEREVEVYENYRHPAGNSLHAFLDESGLDWKSNLGRIIKPELLVSSDLAPALSDLDSHSAFGVILSVDSLEIPDVLQDNEVLGALIEEKKKSHSDACLEKDKVEARLKKIKLELDEIRVSITLLKSRRSTAEDTLTRFKNNREMVLDEVNRAIKERILSSKEQLKLKESELVALKSNYGRGLLRLDDEFRDSSNDEMSNTAGIIQPIELSIRNIESEIEKLTVQKDSHLKAIYQDFKLAQTGKGIDPNETASLKERIDFLHHEITSTEERLDEVRQYDDWYLDIYMGELVKKQEKVETLKRQAADIEKRKASLKKAFNLEIGTLNAKKTGAEQKKRSYSDILGEMGRLHNQCVGFENDSLAPPIDTSLTSLDHAVGELSMLLDEFDQTNNEITKSLKEIESLVSQSGSPTLVGVMSKLYSEAEQSVSVCADSLRDIKRTTYLTREIPRTIKEQLSNIEELQKNGARTYGKKFKQLHGTLQAYHKQIDNESRRLKRAIAENLDLDGISSTEVGLESKIKSLDYWDVLKGLVVEYDKWSDDGFAGLPSEAFLAALSDMKNILPKVSGNMRLEDLFDLYIRVTEYGKSPIDIRTDTQLNGLSSNGMKYLIECKLAMAFTRMLTPSPQTVIHWPVDELGELHGENIVKLFSMLDKNNIVMLGALPQTSQSLRQHFSNVYMINKATNDIERITNHESGFIAQLKARQEEKKKLLDEE